MLDTDTKRRIDTARDILVGKVPDPKSQVEQITIALIYKFMDDMDAEAEELGGKRKFFEGDYARYGWAKLMHSGLGGHETLNLYAEAIAKMPENPGIPPLFRDIFKNAYLPYRDPETLRAFLKVIDEFTYDHSERLGDAFEYLLSVLGSQGDAGQFRTPRHIIDFMVAIVDPKKTETVLDPACGTAGFLISAYKHILHANTDAQGHRTLTPDEKGRLAQNFSGYDISPDMVRLSLVNLYLHGFNDPHIAEYDTLTSLERWNEYADVILANPPFMSPKGGIKPHKRFSVPSNRSEVLFVDYMLEHLTPHGRAGIVVPEGVVFQSGAAYKRLRDALLKDALIGVISLPSGVFQPYSGVKTSILILDRRVAKTMPTILFSDVRDIGMSLGMKRTLIERNDLPHVIKDYEAYYTGGALSPHSWRADRSAVFANAGNLSGERYRPVEVGRGTRSVKIREVCSLTRGSHSSTKSEPGPYPLIVTAEGWLTSADYQIEGEAVCVPLISSSGHGRASIKRIHFASGQFAVANLLVALQTKDAEVLDVRFLYHVLNPQKEAMAGLMNGAANVSMKVEDLAEFQIPLPPVVVQRELVTEIEGYQRVMDGARGVVEGYRPNVPTQPGWPTISLGEICSLVRGVTYARGDEVSEGGHQILRANNINREDSDLDLSDIKHIAGQLALPDEKRLRRNDIFICLASGSKDHIGKVAFIPEDTDFYFGGFMGAVRCKDSRVTPRFLFLQLVAPHFNNFLRNQIAGANINNLSGSILSRFRIPLPPVAEQHVIAAEIEAEMALVAASRDLMTRFENKIQVAVARAWGVEETQPAQAES